MTYQGLTRVNLTECIGPAFYDIYWDIKDGKHSTYELDGGRGSLKSTFVATMIVLGILEDRDANAMIYRKVAATISDSVYEQILWVLNKLQIAEDFSCTTSPFRCTYKPTGQRITFKGLDKAKKQKSSKVARGYYKYIWFEEYDEFSGANEIRSVRQSMVRGGNKFIIFKTYNKPITKQHWVNKEALIQAADSRTLQHHSDYLSAPAEWLGDEFIDDAIFLKEVNPKAYEHEYMGIPIGDGSNVFDNLEIRKITQEEIDSFDYIYRGLDFGWYPDPAQYIECSYNTKTQTLYIYKEYRCRKQRNDELWYSLKNEMGVTGEDLITCDREKKSVEDLRTYGAFAREARKGPGSVKVGTKWLQARVNIVIDPVTCPEAAKEFQEYEYIKTADGEVTSDYPDKNNHAIDATRYALERLYLRGGI